MYNEFSPVFLEGLSYLLLLFVDVQMKYVKGEVGLVKSFGMPNGILFVPFVFLAFSVRSKMNWNFATKMLVSMAPPFFLALFILTANISILNSTLLVYVCLTSHNCILSLSYIYISLIVTEVIYFPGLGFI